MRVRAWWLSGLGCIGLLVLGACSPDRYNPASLSDGGEGGSRRLPLLTGGTVVRGGAGGAAGHVGEGGAAAAAGAPRGEAGTAGSAGQPISTGGVPNTGGEGGSPCGNGELDAGEPCDGDLLDNQTCVSLGFDEGTLSCVDCELVTAGCSGTERCFEGRDNDGDGLSDCDDPDCSDACDSLCGFSPTLSDPDVVTGDTSGHTSATSASCRDPESTESGPTGREIAYRFVPAQDGVLEASITSDAALTLSVRTSCEQASAEIACAFGQAVTAPVSEGEAVYLLVDGVTMDEHGPFELSVASRPIDCGDGIIDDGEQCDDGAAVGGDGCDSSCQVDSTETEPPPNDTWMQADDYADPFYGMISPAGDVDVIAVEVATAPATITARTLGLGDACETGELDSYVEILDPSGDSVSANDDFGGTLCSRATHQVTAGLPGTYFVRVSAYTGGDTPVFPYELEVVVD